MKIRLLNRLLPYGNCLIGALMVKCLLGGKLCHRSSVGTFGHFSIRAKIQNTYYRIHYGRWDRLKVQKTVLLFRGAFRVTKEESPDPRDEVWC